MINLPNGDSRTIQESSVRIGHDLIQLLSSSMYVEPLTLFREYIQNSADSIECLPESNVLATTARIDINADVLTRSITIRDNGAGLSNELFEPILLSVGASHKRTKRLRGFRGVGRLVGLGYCQSLIFRSRSDASESVLELTWDCRALRHLFRDSPSAELAAVVAAVAKLRRISEAGYPANFFEVELRGVMRFGSDELLNADAISDYLKQVAPLPFSPQFSYRNAISKHLSEYLSVAAFTLFINGRSVSLNRPYTDSLNFGNSRHSHIVEIENVVLPALDEGISAVGWIAHHDYSGSLPRNSNIRGIRVRDGNIQVGSADLLNPAFQEERFNAWSVGELHVVDRRLVPNGRRDDFERNAHLGNLFNQFAPIARKLSKRCRTSSSRRNHFRSLRGKISELNSVVASVGSSSQPLLILYAAQRVSILADRIDKAVALVDIFSIDHNLGNDIAEAKLLAKKLNTRAARYKDERRKPRVRGQFQVLEALFDATESSKDRDKIRLATFRALMNVDM